MKKRHLVYAIALIVGMGACAASAKKQAEAKPDAVSYTHLTLPTT